MSLIEEVRFSQWHDMATLQLLSVHSRLEQISKYMENNEPKPLWLVEKSVAKVETGRLEWAL